MSTNVKPAVHSLHTFAPGVPQLVANSPVHETQFGQRTLLCLSVQKRFGDVQVVRDLSLSVVSSQILALLGSSGCGKTTTLRMIAGLEHIDGGCIEVDGELVAGAGIHTAPERRRIGMVFQDFALFPHLTVARNVSFGLERGDNARRRVDEALDLVGLGGFGERLPQDLSGGQQQRVALARALAPKPRVLLMDEPFSNLDPDLRVAVRREVRDILREATATAVLVTHDQEEALSTADRVALMIDGGIAQTAKPEVLYSRPVSREVASFIGEAYYLPGAANGDIVETEIGKLPLAGPAVGAVDVLLRPEFVRLSSSHEDDCRAAIVTRHEYFGKYHMIGVQLRSGTFIKAMTGPGTHFGVGEFVQVSSTVPLIAFPGLPAQ